MVIGSRYIVTGYFMDVFSIPLHEWLFIYRWLAVATINTYFPGVTKVKF
jgi:hypothetical protein